MDTGLTTLYQEALDNNEYSWGIFRKGNFSLYDCQFPVALAEGI